MSDDQMFLFVQKFSHNDLFLTNCIQTELAEARPNELQFLLPNKVCTLGFPKNLIFSGKTDFEIRLDNEMINSVN